MKLSKKVEYVKKQRQWRTHDCHWPGCNKQVPPAIWGCRPHWYKLPLAIRNAIWRSYQPGQEITLTPSKEYVVAARRAQKWIQGHLIEKDKAD